MPHQPPQTDRKPNTVAIIGGGFAGLSALENIVRAAAANGLANLHISIFERGNEIGPGLPYAVNQPDEFMLNHQLNYMGSINVKAKKPDSADFYRWVQENLDTLVLSYPGHDLRNPRGYVPRSLYGRYLTARYEDIKAFAVQHGITITPRTGVEVNNIGRNGRHFTVDAGSTSEPFDKVVLATGNWFRDENKQFAETGRAFLASEPERYMQNDAIPDHATMLIKGTGLSAYDAAIKALESGKYEKVVMASRHGNLRKVRGIAKSYKRKFLTIANLDRGTGYDKGIFRLKDVEELLQKELEHAYGRPVPLKDAHSVPAIIQQLRDDIAAVENDEELKWYSILKSIPEHEINMIKKRLTPEDRAEFDEKYSSLLKCFQAPMSLSTAKKLLRFIEDGKLELVNGIQSIDVNENRKFELSYARQADGLPVLYSSESGTLGDRLKRYPPQPIKHPATADVFIDATGQGRNIKLVPLYAKLIDGGIVEAHPDGGIRIDTDTHRVIGKNGWQQKNVYALGTMSSGEVAQPYNSVVISRLTAKLGKGIVDSIIDDRTVIPLRKIRKGAASILRDFAIAGAYLLGVAVIVNYIAGPVVAAALGPLFGSAAADICAGVACIAMMGGALVYGENFLSRYRPNLATLLGITYKI